MEFDEPKNEQEASRKPEWLEAEREELKGLKEKSVYEEVERPVIHPVLPARMIYKTSQKSGQNKKCKARYVVVGCADPYKNVKETYAPTLGMASLRLLIAVAGLLGAIMHQMDVKQAFLNSVLPHPVYIERPRNHFQGSKKVWKLLKALYGLVDAPKLWYEMLKKFLITSGFEVMVGEPCIFVKQTKIDGKEHIIVVGVFVDDFILFSTNQKLLEETKRMISQKFEVSDLGEAKIILGIRVRQERNTVKIDQINYVEEILKKYPDYKRKLSRIPKTPISPGLILKASTEADEMTTEPYREVVGSLAYLMIGTRPDLGLAVSILSRHLQKPTQEHWDVAMSVLQFPHGTSHKAISYRKKWKANEFNEAGLNKLEANEVEPWKSARL